MGQRGYQFFPFLAFRSQMLDKVIQQFAGLIRWCMDCPLPSFFKRIFHHQVIDGNGALQVHQWPGFCLRCLSSSHAFGNKAKIPVEFVFPADNNIIQHLAGYRGCLNNGPVGMVIRPVIGENRNSQFDAVLPDFCPGKRGKQMKPVRNPQFFQLLAKI